MANEDQAKFWTEQGGPVWLANEALLEGSAERFGVRALEAADITAGERVIDIGCGTGRTTVDIARRVGDAGHVLGLDISPLLLGRAQEHAKAAGTTNATFTAGDAQTHPLADENADLVFSRFGVMFFEDPVAAFANLRSGLRPGGRLAFVCWKDAPSNAWMSVPVMAAASVLGPPDPPPPDAPGPFRFGEPELVRSILGDAGFGEISVDDFSTTMDTPVQGADERLSFVLRMGPIGAKYAEADDVTQKRALEAILDAAAAYESDGAYRLPAATWIVTARA